MSPSSSQREFCRPAIQQQNDTIVTMHPFMFLPSTIHSWWCAVHIPKAVVTDILATSGTFAFMTEPEWWSAVYRQWQW